MAKLIPMDILLHAFHDFFDGLIGFEDRQKFDLSIYLSQKILLNPKFSTPVYFHQSHETKRRYDVNGKDILIKSVPVDSPDGKIFIPSVSNDNLQIPDTITTCQNRLAIVEIRNISHAPLQVEFLEPISLKPHSHYTIIQSAITPSMQNENTTIRVQTTLIWKKDHNY